MTTTFETIGSLTRIVPGARFEVYGMPEFAYISLDEEIIWIGPYEEIYHSFTDACMHEELRAIYNLQIGESFRVDENNFYIRLA